MSLEPNRLTPLTQAQFADSFGGSLICEQVMLPLFGLSIIQAYLYFLNYGKDPRWLKAFVACVWTLGAVHALMVCHTGYYYLVLSYTNPLSLVQGEWSVYTATAVSVPLQSYILLTAIAEIEMLDLLLLSHRNVYFARMLVLLTNGRWRVFIATVYGILIPAQIAFGILVTYKLFALWDLSKLHSIVYPDMVPLFLLRVVTDAFTALTLCIVLYDAHMDFGKTRSLIRTLIVYSINRFILTTQVSCIPRMNTIISHPATQCIIVDAQTQFLGAMAMEFVTGHLYINSFLATLNARSSLRKDDGVVEMNDNSFRVASRRRTGLGTTCDDGIRIDSETFVLADNTRDVPTKSVEHDVWNAAKIPPV
ncbi:hypothetical protein K438DRAFT_1965841 [Mycena galopus ATCC 62051]|nr:hypothetical protein K438DRAFT_1965841 [Mycena galopus ATCC 62051]